MNYLFFLIPLIVTFLTTLFLMPFWIRKSKEIGLIWDDMNKFNKPKVSGSGGLIACLSFVIGVLIFVAYRVFYLSSDSFLVEIFAILTVILFLVGIGLIDDIFGWQRGGLSRRSRIILVIFASIPLMAINAGRHVIDMPLFGTINLGIFYPLILIPLGIVGASTTFNFLAGFNGLEAGQGIIILSALAIVSYFTGSSWLSIILLIMVSALFAFILFNYAPAKVFPGDSLTYSIGGLIAISAIIGNFERIAVFFFIPYIIEVLLKSRGKFVKQSFGEPLPDNSLKLKYSKIYGLTHLSILILNNLGIRPTERKVVLLIWVFQLIIVLIGFILFRQGIFGV